ncbi:MAG: GNAT family N-acetyltransferase [Phycisphaerae bacterium]|nr:GNAT family N-acetyltransferase [Saprospiraceae bacterium]
MRDAYIQFCQKQYLPIHFQPWWLEAVCGPNGWKVALATDKSGEIIGVFPYYLARRWGLKVIQLPPLTTYGGPWLNYPQDFDFKEVSRLSFEKKIMAELIRQLPRTVFLKLNFRPEITNWLPFYWEGFRQTTRYTYIFEETNDLEKITAGFKNTLRSDLKKADQWTEMRRDDKAWETVFALNKLSFQRKNRRHPYASEVFKNLHEALQQRNQSACFVAFDKASGRPSAGLYLAFDQRQAAVLMTGTAPEFKSQCAVYGLFLEALRFCAEHALSLDFEGSMDENIEHAFRAFGARLVPYFQIIRWGM